MAAFDVQTHHDLAVHEVILIQGTDENRGLEEGEAADRHREFGPNELPRRRTSGVGSRIVAQIRNPLILVLIAAGIAAAVLGTPVDAAVIVAVVILNAIIGIIQESRAEAALAVLTAMVRTRATVVRSGSARVIDSRDLVPGDVVVVSAGDRVPADLRVVAESELAVDESALTGESVPVEKDEAALPRATEVSDRRNMLYSGTLVTRGTGRGIVVAIGAGTEFGEIHRLMGATVSVATPLTRRITGFSRWLTLVILGLAGITFVIGLLRGETASQMLTAAIALAVAVIPEGLPAVVTITLAIGVARMARRGAIIRHLPAVEALGSTTVICTDKTGTLTQNRMTVVDTWFPDDWVPDAERDAVLAATLCTEADVGAEGPTGDPTEVALLRWALERGVDVDGVRRAHPRTSVVPFSSERGLMVTGHDGGVLLSKGAPERVLAHCGPHPEADRRAAAFAERGYRVLATAAGSSANAADEDAPWQLTGLLALQDPPREAVPSAVQACHAAGIEVRMVTGDHAGTAEAIARQVGILGEGQDPAGLVYARVAPADKLALVSHLQADGNVVAMTGDGVNDAPALRRADIGIAMGKAGTDVAIEAADMVLTDDDFATVEAAVEEGRGVFDNLIRYLVWALPTSLGEGLVILVAILWGATLPILPAQILWINLTTAVALGLMLAFEVREPGIMERPPRSPGRSLLTRGMVWRIGFVAALIVAATWSIFIWETMAGVDPDTARTSAVNTVVAIEIGYLILCRSLRGPSRALGWFSNPWIFLGIGVQVIAQIVLTYVPVAHALFDTAPLGIDSWVRLAVIVGLVWTLIAVEKRLARYAFA